MGLDTIPERTNGQPIDQTWFNVIRSVLNGDFVPRDADGVVGDQEASLGTSSLRWLYAYMMGLYLFNGNRSVKLEAPSGILSDFTIQLPSALPGSGSKIWFVNSAGESSLTLTPDGTTIEISGTTIRVKDASITRAKLAAMGQQISSSCGAYSTTTTADITNLSVTITTSGRPVYLALISDGSGNDSTVSSVGGTPGIQFKRGVTSLARLVLGSGVTYPASEFTHIDPVAAGTYTYTAAAIITGSTMNVNYAKLIAFEL